jgi:soluble lytic murein transglycosylase-like protein
VPRLVVLLAGLVVLVALAVGVWARDDGPPAGVAVVPTPPGAHDVEPFADPYAWDAKRADDFVQRAADGNSHVLYALSPGGVVTSAERTARWRPLIERAAAPARVDPDMLEALVFLESAGRDDARAPGGLDAAAGLTQILAETADNLLGMHVDVAASTRYTRRLERAQQRGRGHEVAALRENRRRVDDRFDPEKALAGTVRYLELAREKLGREDLAFVAYHMGIGNLQNVLRDYGAGTPSYAELYFNSTPTQHAAAYWRLAGFGDDSANYLWKLYAARQIMHLWRDDRPELERLASLQLRKASAEEVLHPADRTPAFVTPGDLSRAWDTHAIVPFPDATSTTGLQRDASMGELARRLHVPAGMYRGLRPEALAMAIYIGAQVRAISRESPLIVTSTVRDGAYQALLLRRNGEATRGFSLHTTGWTFDIARMYRSKRQALAFQFVLDRLRSLNAIAWVREPDAIHITVSSDAERLLPLLDRVNIEAP